MWFVGKNELLSLIQRHCLDEVMPTFSDHRTLRKTASSIGRTSLANMSICSRAAVCVCIA